MSRPSRCQPFFRSCSRISLISLALYPATFVGESHKSKSGSFLLSLVGQNTCQAMPTKIFVFTEFRICCIKHPIPARKGATRETPANRGSGCGGRGRCCARLAGAVKRSRVAPMARTRQPIESPENARDSEIRWSWREDVESPRGDEPSLTGRTMQ